VLYRRRHPFLSRTSYTNPENTDQNISISSSIIKYYGKIFPYRTKPLQATPLYPSILSPVYLKPETNFQTCPSSQHLYALNLVPTLHIDVEEAYVTTRLYVKAGLGVVLFAFCTITGIGLTWYYTSGKHSGNKSSSGLTLTKKGERCP
jgi:hypothetical protein